MIDLTMNEIACCITALKELREITPSPSPAKLASIDGILEKLGVDLRAPLTEPETFNMMPGYNYQTKCAVCGMRIEYPKDNPGKRFYHHIPPMDEHLPKVDTTAFMYFFK